MTLKKVEPIKDIPANNDLPNEGAVDPEPEKGQQGSLRRRFWSAVKGIFGK